MAKFTVEHDTKRTPEETYKVIKEVLSKNNEITKFDANAKCSFDDGKKTCQISGGQFKADLKVAASTNSSKVSITVDLPMLLLPFKGKVQETLKKMLSKHLA